MAKVLKFFGLVFLGIVGTVLALDVLVPGSKVSVRNASSRKLENVELRYVTGPNGKIGKTTSLGGLPAGAEVTVGLRPPGESGLVVAAGVQGNSISVTCTGYIIYGATYSATLSTSQEESSCSPMRKNR